MKKEKGKNIVTQNASWCHYGRQADTIQTDKNIAKKTSLCTAAPALDFFEGRGGCTQATKRPDNTSLSDPRGSRGNPKGTHVAVNKDIHPIISPHPRYKPEEGGSTQQMFIRGGSAPRFNPLSFCIPFFTKTVPLSCTFYWQMVLLSHTLFRTLHPFYLL